MRHSRHDDVPADGGSGAGPEPSAGPEPDPEPELQRSTTRRRVVGWSLIAIGVFLIVSMGWVAWRTYQAYDHLRAAQTIVAQAKSEVSSAGLSNLASLTPLVDDLRAETSAAHSAVDDPLYRAATVLPWLGSNLDAIRTVSVTLDSIAGRAHDAVPALTLLADPDQWAGHGTFDLAVLKPAADSVIALDGAITDAQHDMSALDGSSLAGPVARAANDYVGQLDSLADHLSAAATTARVAIPMLGADGPRTYLVAFQNLAETRPTGGIFGFYAVLTVDNGTITLGKAGSSDREFGPFSEPVLDEPPTLTQLYWPGIALWPQAVNFSPSFPRAAELFSAMYTKHSGQHVDGVIGIDPVVVSALLKGVAPIPLGHGLTLSSATAVPVLLSDIYTVFPGGNQLAERDELMRSAMTTAFSAVLDNTERLAPKELLAVTTDLAEQRRLLIWSAHDDEQRILGNSAVGGLLPPDAVGRPTVGVFLNDGVGGKLDYYLRASAALAAPQCSADGSAQTTLAVTLKSVAPKSGLPPYVVGDSQFPGNQIVTNVILTAPTSGSIEAVTIDGKAVPVRRGGDMGRSIAIFSMVTDPGQEVTAQVKVTMEPAAQGDTGATVSPRLVTTPMASPFPATARPFRSCASAAN